MRTRGVTSIKMDFDGPFPRDFLSRLTLCCRAWEWKLVACRVDRTRRGWHVTALVRGVKQCIVPLAVVAAQAILGSDRNREMFNLMRVLHWDELSPYWRERWNVLYEWHLRGV